MYDEYNALIEKVLWFSFQDLMVPILVPIVKSATVRVVLSLTLTRHWLVYQMDIKNSFLNGDLLETMYMHQAPSFVDHQYPHHVCCV